MAHESAFHSDDTKEIKIIQPDPPGLYKVENEKITHGNSSRKVPPDLGMELYDVKKIKLALHQLIASGQLTEEQAEKELERWNIQETYALERELKQREQFQESVDSQAKKRWSFSRRKVLDLLTLSGGLAVISYGMNYAQQTLPVMKMFDEKMNEGGQLLRDQGTIFRNTIEKAYENNFTPEGIARRNKELEEQKKRIQLEYEQSHALSFQPTVTSQSGWRLRRVHSEKGVTYREIDPLQSLDIKFGDQIVLSHHVLGVTIPGPFLKEGTSIYLNEYQNSQDDSIPKFVVVTDSGWYKRTTSNEYVWERKGDAPTDSEVLALEKMQRDEARDKIVVSDSHLITVSEMNIKPGYNKVRFMEKVSSKT